MENTTEVVNEVLEDVVEETATNSSFGTFATGGILLIGTATVIYGAVKGTKWGIKKVKEMVDYKKSAVEDKDHYTDCDVVNSENPKEDE